MALGERPWPIIVGAMLAALAGGLTKLGRFWAG